ncbi:MAG TPA: hypothetical protein VMZ53_07980 [Kofleriaceae bacterium]|nr:hypothetical protein [Kofleriaceae bacterium]
MRRIASVVVRSLLLSCACNGSSKPTHPVAPPTDAATRNDDDALGAIRNDNIEYATYTRPDDRRKVPPGLYRQVSVTAPQEAFALTRSGDMRAFDLLVPMLDDPERNWAAFVMLAALTGHEAATVIAFDNAAGFKGSAGERDARKNWEAWLADHRATLTWDAERHQFRTAQ